jgi:hypothetical protein
LFISFSTFLEGKGKRNRRRACTKVRIKKDKKEERKERKERKGETMM